jgi:nuclear pore complex protein Nup210
MWKHRNDCVFNGAQPYINNVINKIKEEAVLWTRAGAQGLRMILPQTWDVH